MGDKSKSGLAGDLATNSNPGMCLLEFPVIMVEKREPGVVMKHVQAVP